ncbi:MAG: phosphoribosyltransferase [Rhodococcus sp.]|nr:phosphoribosyltransferase [Rhodococcus sp. (in: high G+C Gram-positive bacteria)]
MHYSDRTAAGRTLCDSLTHLRGRGVVVLALPRGGVPVGREVALALHAPFDILVVRKLGLPWQPELAMGAIGEGGTRVMNDDVVRHSRVSPSALKKVEADERHELARRAKVLRGGRPRIDLHGRTVVLVDDGMATGATVAVACHSVRIEGADRVIVAVPVACPEAVQRVNVVADEVVCPWIPTDLGGVGAAYDDFHQLTDTEASNLL